MSGHRTKLPVVAANPSRKWASRGSYGIGAFTSALMGARNIEQLDNSLDAAEKLQFTLEELAEIDRHAQDAGINVWKGAREGIG